MIIINQYLASCISIVIITTQLLYIASGQYQQQKYENFLNKKPQTFGVTCVTLHRSGSFQTFQQFFQKTSQMQCPQFTELLIIWNNKQNPGDVLQLYRQKWKRRVIFHQTPYNSFNFRYEIPKQAAQSVYLSTDDQFNFQCDFLEQSFALVQYHSIGDIGSVVGMEGRDYVFQHNNTRPIMFTQSWAYDTKFFSFQLSGCAWIFRKQFNAYTIPNHKALQQIRKIVNDTVNCDDVAFTYISYYFYPEIKFVHWGSTLQTRHQQSSLWGQQSIRDYRETCFTQLTDLFGYMPMPRIKHFQSKRLLPLSIDRFVLYVRQKYYERIIYQQKLQMLDDIERGDNIYGKGQSKIIMPQYQNFDRSQLELSINLTPSIFNKIKYDTFTSKNGPKLFRIQLLLLGILASFCIQIRKMLRRYGITTNSKYSKLDDKQKQQILEQLE